MAPPQEHVLVIPTLLFREIGYFQGFCSEPDRYLSTLLDPEYTSYRARDEMENDPSFKQLIPYCIFHCDGAIFHYRRGTSQGESRLHAKRSIGIGGHVSTDDAASDQPFEQGMWREIEEEIIVEAPQEQRCLGLINDDETDVGQVHLGVVFGFALEATKVRAREESIIETGFASPEELIDDRSSFESWSQICLDHLASRSNLLTV